MPKIEMSVITSKKKEKLQSSIYDEYDNIFIFSVLFIHFIGR